MSKKNDAFSALRFKDFRFYLLARLFSIMGFQVMATCIGWQIYKITNDPLSLGLIGLAEAIPFIMIALYAGHIADNFNRKYIIVLSVSVYLLCAFALLTLSIDNTFIETYGTLPLYSLILLTGIARGFLGPAMFAFMSQLVPREEYANAATWNSTVWQIGAVSGPALGGLVYGFIGLSSAYILNSALVFTGLLLFMMIASRPLVKPTIKEKISDSLTAGLKYVFNNQVMLAALSLDLFAVLFGGAVALLPIFAAEVLHTGPEGLGLLRSAPAAGAVIMAIIIAYNPLKENAGKWLLICVAGFGLCMIGFALSNIFLLSFILLALSGALDNVSVIVRGTIVQLMTPDHMKGRVTAVNSIFIGSSNEIGAFESGLAARLMGLVPSVIFGGCMTLGIVGITAKFAPKLRKMNLQQFVKQRR